MSCSEKNSVKVQNDRTELNRLKQNLNVLKRAVKQKHAATHFKRVARLRSLAVAVVCLEFSRRQTSSMSQ